MKEFLLEMVVVSETEDDVRSEPELGVTKMKNVAHSGSQTGKSSETRS